MGRLCGLLEHAGGTAGTNGTILGTAGTLFGTLGTAKGRALAPNGTVVGKGSDGAWKGGFGRSRGRVMIASAGLATRPAGELSRARVGLLSWARSDAGRSPEEDAVGG